MVLKASELMTKSVHTLSPDDSVNFLRFIMESQHIRHVPIVDKNNYFLGLLTHRDLLNVSISSLADIDQIEIAKLHANIQVKEIMKKDIVTVQSNANLKDIAQLMYDKKYGCLPVLEGKKLVGIITEADFVNLTLKLLEYAEQVNVSK